MRCSQPTERHRHRFGEIGGIVSDASRFFESVSMGEVPALSLSILGSMIRSLSATNVVVKRGEITIK